MRSEEGAGRHAGEPRCLPTPPRHASPGPAARSLARSLALPARACVLTAAAMLAELKDRRIPFLFFANKSDIAGWCAIALVNPGSRRAPCAERGLAVVPQPDAIRMLREPGPRRYQIEAVAHHVRPCDLPRPLGRFNSWAVLCSHCCGLTGEGIEAGVSWLTEKLSRD